MTITTKILSALTLSLLTTASFAAVSTEEAAKLGTTLTPLGGEMQGNADGSIPAWTGGLAKNAAPIDAKGFLGNPFSEEKPIVTITAQNFQKYKDKLSEGMLAMFERYPATFKMPIYQSHRTVNVPDEIKRTAQVSAVKTTLMDGGNGLLGFSDSHYYPFPIPKNGLEVIWNHVTRYRGGNFYRFVTGAAPQQNGGYTLVTSEERLAFPSSMPDLSKTDADNVLYFFTSRTVAPARLAGNVMLVHDSLDQVKQPRMAWLYNSGQRRVRRAPQISYDSPTQEADGLRVADEYDMFNGSPDRYEWKLIGKKEQYIPYNNYKVAAPQVKYSDILQAGHDNPDLLRYELHRVWVVEATLKSTERHIYGKRRFYVDEDSWNIAQSENYDGRGQLWRINQLILTYDYASQAPWYAYEVHYDLLAGRYNVAGMMNEESSWIKFGAQASPAEFTPAALRSAGVR